MDSKVCMNVICGAASSNEWRRGWALRSGELAILCDKCGLAFEQMTFCDTFHSNDSGWRECTSCGKRLHCGCIASKSVLELLDIGGVNCISCARNYGVLSITTDQKLKEFGTLTVKKVGGLEPSSLDHQNDCHSVIKPKPMQLDSNLDCLRLNNLIQSCSKDANGACGSLKQEEKEEIGSTCFQILNQGCSIELSQISKPDIYKKNVGVKDVYELPVQTNLSITLGASLGNSNHSPSVGEVREQNKAVSPFQQGPRSRHLLPKPPNPVVVTCLEQNIGKPPQIRVARPPAEGRGRNQLLPRYWPRITDQELQQISGDSNSTIVPLFEKVLSASDAGRIGRLVLPKACAEAYFPPISQPEGLPLRIQDVKGKEWVFQFRFWPNNNSRMYVLEGVTPCIQSMQLQAGDTVTFSRMDPEGKLVMGFRKAANLIAMQETQPSVVTNGTHSNENFLSSVMENLPIVSGYPSLLQSLKGSTDAHLNLLSKRMNSASGEVGLLKTETLGGQIVEGLLSPPMMVPERKKSRNIGSKSKRLLIDSKEALELRLTWEEAQDLLRPPPSVMPSVVTIEDHEFEEYEEPPVFGKRTIFTIQSSGGQEQWVQCDSCSKWRRLPIDILLPPRWTCTDNTWDQSRCSCSAPDELSPRELENLLRLNREFKRQRIATSQRPTREKESSGLDALANAAVLGENVNDPGTTSVAATTKHPRHRPGCSCIVCIQPPSGKGKHKPTCDCNVCMTVKRRFKTLMLRKKKRQSDREAEIALRSRNTWGSKDETELGNTPQHVSSHKEPSENEGKLANDLESGAQCSKLPHQVDEPGKGQIDLNCHPDREEDPKAVANRVSMMSLLQVASHPLESYLKQNGLASFISEQQACSGVPQATKGGQEESCHASTVPVRESGSDEGGSHQPVPNQNHPA